MSEVATPVSKLTPDDARRCLELVHQARGAMECWIRAYRPEGSTEIDSRSAWQPQVAAAAIADTVGTAYSLADRLPSLDLLHAQGLASTIDAALFDGSMLLDGSAPPMDAAAQTMRMAADLVAGFLAEFEEDLELVAAAHASA